MTTINDIALTYNDGSTGSTDDFRGTLLLVVNTASECGFTPQYEGLQKLQDTYGDRGFSVLGVPCNQFGGQEPGTDAQVADFCSTNFGVTFPLLAKTDVNGAGAHPLYEELRLAHDTDGESGDVKWNFEKFLVSPGGEVIGRFRSGVAPDAVELHDQITANLPE